MFLDVIVSSLANENLVWKGMFVDLTSLRRSQQDDAMTRKRCPRRWPIVRRIQRPVNSPLMYILDVFLVVNSNTLLNKQASYRWFKTH